MIRLRAFVVLLLALPTPAPAQGAPAPRLVAWSETAGPALFNGVQTQPVDAACLPASMACRSLLGAPQFYAGGTTYDPRHDAVWMTNGTIVQEIELATCTVRCQFTAQVMNSSAVVSGLAMLDGGRRLLQLETFPGHLGLRSYDTTVCPPTPLRDGCIVALSTGALAGGLAVDPAGGLVFFSVSTPTALDWQTEIVAARDSDRCNALCRVTLPRCGPFYPRSGVVTGLAYDNCNRRLFATNGRHTQALDVSDGARCVMTQTWCCPTGSTWDYKGLAYAPATAARTVGAGCAPVHCLPCAAQATLAGAPVLGNRDFAIGLASAEVGSHALLVLGGGACTSGVGFPFLCGPLYPSLLPPPFVSPPLPVLGSGGGCLGATQMNVPVPLERSLCGAPLCAQWAIACSTIASALAMSDAVQFTLGG